MKGAAIRRILELIAELASVLARIDPFLLAKNGPHSKHDFASEATVRACFVEGLGARQRCWREPNALAFGSQLPTQLPRMALSRVAESLPLIGLSGAAITGPFFASKPGSILDSVEELESEGLL
jgi:hypothetical protein